MKAKITFIISFLFLFSGTLFAQQPEKPIITFDETVFDFGQIPKKQQTATHVFSFTNTGTADLIIKDAITSCGCTVPEWTQTPIKPGEKGIITITYNTWSKGVFQKKITIKSNAEPKKTQLTIKGEVTDK